MSEVMISSYAKSFTRMALIPTLWALLWALCFLNAPRSALGGVEDAEPMERIVARVGSYPILISELASQVQIIAMQSGFKSNDTLEILKFQQEVLQQLVNEKLFLIAAQQDTTLRVTEDEVREALDRQIDQISSRFATEQGFLDALAEEGMTLSELRRKFYSEIENRLLKDQFISRKLSSINVSRQEVSDFYKKYSDSIPDQPAGIRLAHILLEITSSEQTSDSAKQIALEVRKKAVAGESFDALALEYSAPPAGDLGFVRREEVTDAFGNAAFALQAGDISGLVRTKVGYHVLKCLERDGDSIRVSQIFFPLSAAHSDTLRIWKLAQELKDSLDNGASFAELAKEYSNDDDTRRTEGRLGWYAYLDLPPEFQGFISQETVVGSIIGPLQSQFGLHLVKALEKQEESKISLESHYDEIREFARRRKTDRLIEEWVEQRKKDTYVEIRSINDF